MKRSLNLALVTLLALTLSACAGTGQHAETGQVKCPACGYEFEAPLGG
jgi:uncharacterized Zn finger protein (UPF0148 family)